MSPFGVGRAFVCGALTLSAVVSCLPVDSRPPAGSLFLAVVSADEPTVTTADGWSISVDRLLLGIGYASLGNSCTHYSDTSYTRLLDGRLPQAQKVNIIFGLGQCYFQFNIAPPSSDSLLGEGVTEADKDRMGARDDRGPRQPPDWVTIDFAATASRGGETKQVHWMLRQLMTYWNCARRTEAGASQMIRLESDENVTLHIGVRGVELFGDDESTTSAELRFDPFAYADKEFGDGDGDVTLDEMGQVDLNRLRGFGPYSAGSDTRHVPHTLEDYVHLVLLPKIVRFREDVTCRTDIGPRSDRPPSLMVRER